MAMYRFSGASPPEKASSSAVSPQFDDKTLLVNVHWFIRVRWIVIFLFIATGLFSHFFSEFLAAIDLAFPEIPLFLMALFLLMINSFYYLISLKLTENNHRKIFTILWVQIITDLIFVTVLVYYIGSTDTFIPFIYLIHITLSCIFFSRFKSIIVVTISACFYFCIVLFQNARILQQQSIFLSSPMESSPSPLIKVLSAISAIFIWFILWYFISTLSEGIKERDASLRIANEELKLADEEKTKKVLVTTHDLKAPFAGIESNISILKYLHWEEIPESFREILDKIEVRSKTLRERIDKILELGNLRIQQKEEIPIEPVKLKHLFDGVLSDISDQILERKIRLEADIQDITVDSNEEKLRILFSNLVANAVFYTPEKGLIKILTVNNNNTVQVIISDSGIGIEEEYLDKIFNEYFRTPEARKFNKMSTGLGLQIVKTIINQLGLSITVESEKERGTTFTVDIKQ